MRFLLVTFPVRSHYFPMVPLGWALAAAGHEVRVASHPGFAPAVEAAGLTAVGVGAEPDLGWIFAEGGVAPLPGARPGEALRAARSATMFAEVAADMAGELVPWTREWGADLVVFEPRALAGVIAAAAAGVPAVRFLWGPDYTRGRWELEQAVFGPLLERFGCGTVVPHEVPTLDSCPASMRIVSGAGTRRAGQDPDASDASCSLDAPDISDVSDISGTWDTWDTRFIPYNGAGTPPEWATRAGEQPRVCVTWGTTLAKQSGRIDPAAQAVHAAAALGAEVVVATTADQAPLLGELPDGVRLLESSPPLHLVLPHCAAVIHPGGAGTLMTAAVLGVPQVVVPALADQFLNAECYARTGAGIRVPPGPGGDGPLPPQGPADLPEGEGRAERPGGLVGPPASHANLPEALARVLGDPSYADGAARLARELAAMPPPADAVKTLTALAEQEDSR